MRQRLPIALSVTALFVAVLGFTSVGEAAKQALFPRNSVGSREIKNKAIKGIDIKPSTIGSGKVKNNTIRSADLRDGGVRESDLGAGAVTSSKLGDGSITSSKLGDKSVTTSKWAGGPTARVYNSAAVAIASGGTFAAVPFNMERFDGSGMHDVAVNPSYMTITTPGVYLVGAHITWVANATSVRELNIRVNGATIVARVVQNAAAGGNTTDQSITTLVNLAPGDYVEVVVRQTAGAPVSLSSVAQYTPEFWISWMAPSPS